SYDLSGPFGPRSRWPAPGSRRAGGRGWTTSGPGPPRDHRSPPRPGPWPCRCRGSARAVSVPGAVVPCAAGAFAVVALRSVAGGRQIEPRERPGRQGAGQRPGPRRPPVAHRLDLEDAVVLALAEADPDLAEVGGKGRGDGVAPLDEGHAPLVEQLREAQV